MENFKDNLIRVMKDSFRKLHDASNNKQGRLYIVNGRISEQEIKQLFIESFLADEYFKEYKYSVETPTKNPYVFTEKRVFFDGKSGRSANIDMTIYKDEQLVAMIEFKSKNVGEFEHGKDFLKLKHEPNNGNNEVYRFFVEVYTSSNNRTFKSIYKKLYDNCYCKIADNTNYIGYSLKDKEFEQGGVISCSKGDPDCMAKINKL